MKKGDKVITPHGDGVIVDVEKYNNLKRYGIQLENNPFSFPVAYYFKEDVLLKELSHAKLTKVISSI